MPRSIPLALAVLTLVAIGCSGSGPTPAGDGPTTTKPSSIRLWVVDDEPLAEAIKSRWTSRVEAKLELRNMTRSEVDAEARARPAADLIIFPEQMMGDLVRRKWIDPLRPDESVGQQNPPFPLLHLRTTAWGTTTYGQSFGSPVLLLVYRPEMLEQAGVKPPADWTEYAAAIAALKTLQNAKPTVEPLAEGWAAKTLLSRAAAYARHRDFYATLFELESMKPRITLPPFSRAMEELVAAHELAGGQAWIDLTPQQAWRAVAAGEAAMGVAIVDGSVTGEVEFAELPGSNDVFHHKRNEWSPRAVGVSTRVTLLAVDGRIGAVTSEARHPKQATRMLQLLTGDEWSELLSPASQHTAPFHEAHLESADRWLAEDTPAPRARNYATTVQSALERPGWMFCPRLP
ncbi:MAG: extracellular solute-binding protein, partial [Pirellulaceae bacterium]|nr:extracellular solute-binding protein [Pirellulaceae bacterium]